MSQTDQALTALSFDAARAQYRSGALLVTGAMLAWSSAGLLTRWIAADAWTTLFWRSVFSTLFLGAWLLASQGRRAAADFRRLGWAGWGVAICFATSMICFINALDLTTVANVMVFQAAAPLIAAVFAWGVLKERVSARQVAAIAVTALGVGVMVSDSVASGRVLGDSVSFVMAAGFAGTIILARFDRRIPMPAASCAATVMAALICAPMASFDLPARDMTLLALFGVGQMGLALIMFTAGVQRIPATDAGLISVLESILAPLWVWLAIGENPGARTLIGGAIVVLAVIGATLPGPRRVLRI